MHRRDDRCVRQQRLYRTLGPGRGMERLRQQDHARDLHGRHLHRHRVYRGQRGSASGTCARLRTDRTLRRGHPHQPHGAPACAVIRAVCQRRSCQPHARRVRPAHGAYQGDGQCRPG
nr:MAG TPA: hypothetical protein [Caudoviricetes sp.]